VGSRFAIPFRPTRLYSDWGRAADHSCPQCPVPLLWLLRNPGLSLLLLLWWARLLLLMLLLLLLLLRLLVGKYPACSPVVLLLQTLFKRPNSNNVRDPLSCGDLRDIFTVARKILDWGTRSVVGVQLLSAECPRFPPLLFPRLRCWNTGGDRDEDRELIN